MKNNKFIGINNRISLNTLDTALGEYINKSVIDKDLILKHIKELTSGENRAQKSLNNTCIILKRNESIINKYRIYIKSDNYYDLNINDRKTLILCLFCLTYPIVYDILIIFSKGFKVQEILNKSYLKEKLCAIYGGNRAVHIAIDEVLPLLIEMNLIKKPKRGLFSKHLNIETKSEFLKELVVYTDIFLSASKNILLEDIKFKPFYDYFIIKSELQYQHLVKKTSGSLGQDYLKI
ncbi:MAG: hypothetical protein M0Q94_14195 [Candidatus Cloacimonetes bacterium]|nr:hypothetical protein [Candidatus Cloacimonadota bacterium]